MVPATWSEAFERLAAAGVSVPRSDKDQAALRKALAPVLALAAALERYAPQLLKQQRLRVAIVGAEWLDALDAGRWYSLLGPLTETSLETEGFLLGPQLERGSLGEVNALVAEAPPLTSLQEPLHPFYEQHAGEVDVAMVFQPGLDNETGLLEAPGFIPLLQNGIPVLGSSYSRDEFLMEREILGAFGYACREPADNPLALDLGREEARWGAVLWALDASVLPSGGADRQAVADVQRLSRMLAHSKLQGMLIPIERLGEPFSIPRREGGEREMIYLFDTFYVMRDTGEVFMVDGTALRPTRIVIPKTDMDGYPAHVNRGLDRALWAAHLKEQYLLQAEQ